MKRLSILLNLIKENKVAIFIGAGVSQIAGCSGLADISKKLKEIRAIQELIVNQNPNSPPRKELIAYCKSISSKDDDFRREFDGIMRQGLIYDIEKYNKEYIPFIKKLRQLRPFPPIITTNVDDCLTHTQQFDLKKIYYKIQDLRIDLFRNLGIFHIHGYVEDTSNQLWDLFDYPKRYHDQNFKNFIINVFKEYSVLFLGYGFGDDEELLHLIAQAKRENSQPHIHYALIPTDDDHPHIIETFYEELYNIKIIKYGIKSDFVQFVGKWIDSSFNPVEMGTEEQRSLTPNY